MNAANNGCGIAPISIVFALRKNGSFLSLKSAFIISRLLPA